MLTQEQKQKIINFYKDNIQNYGIGNPGSTGWATDYTQKIRFQALCNIGDLNEKSILDVGCGYGALCSFISDYFPNVQYTGVDIVPEFIALATSQNPSAKFVQGDFTDMDFPQKFDYVLASGVLSHNLSGNNEICFGMIQKMFDLCAVGVGFNFLDKKNHPLTDDLLPYSFQEIYEYCKSITDKIFISNDYLDYDFTIYLYK